MQEPLIRIWTRLPGSIGRCLAVCILLCSLAVNTSADTAKIEFNRDIRPILSDKCFYCHGPDKNHRKADLRLDVRSNAIEDKAIVPGKAAESELIKRILTTDADDLMPPPEAHKELTALQKETLKQWINQGAEYQEHWAYIQPKRTTPPSVSNPKWERTPIDAFILARLEEHKLSPSPEADRRTLLRRLSLDLTGLPPTIAEVEAFVRDRDPKAYEKQVERLLLSPHYGERMAVPWLDAVRFTDTVGYHGDQNQNIFPYREYVINSFNHNKPFDQFTIEQLAGDLLPNPTDEQIIATGFNRLNMMTREGGAQAKEYLAKYTADRVRTIGTAWLGSTLGCAECHNHKFDPFTAKDFYAMGAFFADVKQWGVYSDYKYTPVPELKGWNNEYPFPPEMQVESPYLKARSEAERFKLEAIANVSAQTLAKAKDTRHAYRDWREESLRWLKQNSTGWNTPDKVTITTENTAKKNSKNKKDVAGKPDFLSVTDAQFQADGSIEFSKKRSGDDRYDIALPAMQLASLRLELLPEAGGTNILHDGSTAATIKFKAVLKRASGGKPEALAIDHGMATQWDERYSSGSAVIGVRDMWKVSSKHLDQAQSAVWQFKEGKIIQAGDILEITLDANPAVRVRWSVSPFASLDPFDSSLSATLAELKKQKTPSKSAALAELFLLSSQIDANALAEFRKTRTDWLECRDGHAQTLITVAWKPMESRVLPRGNWQDESGQMVVPFPPEFLTKAKPSDERLTRLDLAKWIVSAENPLTTRVVMNRLWKQFFGNGIYNSIEDIGAQGEWPSHPELLDWLAVEFRESGWDYKHMVRLMVNSAAYRQSSRLKQEVLDADPDNRLLASQNPRRLDAEFVRDNALFVAGLLNLDIGGPSVKPYQPPGYYESLQFPDRDYVANTDERQYRRGLYMHWQRTFLHPMLANFDAPSREECTGVRVVSNTPQQALTLLNDPSFVEAARVLAQEVMESSRSDSRRLEFAFKRVLAREPKDAEKESLLPLLKQQTDFYRSNAEDADKLLKIGISPRNEALPDYEHAAWTSVCRVILNLHETITRY